MNSIKFGEINYSSKYGRDGLRAKTEYVPNQEVQNDSFNPKYKSKTNKKAAGVIGTIALMIASGIAAYKGKGKIQEVAKSASTNIKKVAGEFAEKHTNLAAAGKSLKEAGAHIGEACKKPGKAVAKPFVAAWQGIKKIFTHTRKK